MTGDPPVASDRFADRRRREPAHPTGPLTVSQAVSLAREVLEDNFPRVRIKGEISRFVHHGSGHMYFQLKDRDAVLDAAMFRSDNRRLRFRPEDGMDVLVAGRLSIYEPRGRFQLVASEMEPLGLGSLYLALEQLKERLAAERLFDPERKRPLPMLPRRIGVATSATGAALRDILRVLGRRFSAVPVLIAPCRVQGPGAPGEIVRALSLLDRPGVDVIILARGGGSLEDLWSFNEEAVARAVAASGTPVVTGVGHEIDVTLADLVADQRAPTPSAAAEVVVSSRLELAGRLQGLSRRLQGGARLSLAAARERVRSLGGGPAMAQVPRRLQEAMQRADELRARALRALERDLAARRGAVASLAARLSPRALGRRVTERRDRMDLQLHRLHEAIRSRIGAGRAEMRRLADLLGSVSPLAVLARGYAICRGPDGRLLRSAGQVQRDDRIEVRLHRGEIDCLVLEARAPAPEDR